MIHSITVSPAPAGWAVCLDQDSPRTFASGARAEAWARSMAEALARRGQPSRVEITLRGGALAGRFFYTGSGWSAEHLAEAEPA